MGNGVYDEAKPWLQRWHRV